MKAKEQELKQLARRLYRRRSEGVIVPFLEVELDGWQPSEQDCHANVDQWVISQLEDANPVKWKAVRGWLYLERGRRGCPSFIAHSVVEAAKGTLIDITPTQATTRFPFIRDKGRPGEFARLLARHGLIYVDYEG